MRRRIIYLERFFYSERRGFCSVRSGGKPSPARIESCASKATVCSSRRYRPWYVTKVFWDATPDDKKIFVADPSQGSRHNRGAAVDITLYDLKTGKPVEMVSTYDETTDRAYADYPGGTSLQRWHRKLLRDAMESEGFTVFPFEWWHFDYQDWRRYRIGNVRFEEIAQN